MIRRALGLCVVVFVGCSGLPPEGTGGGGGSTASGGGTGGGASNTGGGTAGGACRFGLADISADTTLSGDVTLDCAVIVRTEVTLTLAAGTNLRVGGTFDVDGSLKVEGTAALPVTISRAGATPWGPLLLRDTFGTRTFSLQHVTLRGAGDPSAVETSVTMGAALVHQVHDVPLLVEAVTIDGASGVGLSMESGPFAAGSTGLTIKNSGSYAMFVSTEHLGTIPQGSYATNAKAAILTGTGWRAPYSQSTRITTDSTIHKFDVPYVVGTGKYKSDIVISTVQGGQPTFTSIPLVTVEPGVTFRFAKVKGAGVYQSLLNVDSAPENSTWRPLGALRAVGTAAAPIVFTSDEATPAAGDWATISFEELDARTQLDHVEIAYAGADARALGACTTGSPTAGGNSPVDGDAAFQQYMNVGAPSRAALTNSLVHDSAGGGVYRAFADTAVDFLATNTFTNVAWCRQTPVKISGSCVPMTCN